jgi:hypothetical protein
VLLEGAPIDHELASFPIGWVIANGVHEPLSRTEEPAFATHVIEGFDVISLGIEDSLAVTDVPVLAVATIDVTGYHGWVLLHDQRLRCNHLGFAEQRSMIARDFRSERSISINRFRRLLL